MKVTVPTQGVATPERCLERSWRLGAEACPTRRRVETDEGARVTTPGPLRRQLRRPRTSGGVFRERPLGDGAPRHERAEASDLLQPLPLLQVHAQVAVLRLV